VDWTGRFVVVVMVSGQDFLQRSVGYDFSLAEDYSAPQIALERSQVMEYYQTGQPLALFEGLD
jgi:hypothetical protein